MSDKEIAAIVIPSIGVIIGIALFIMGFTKLKLKRLIENLPTSKVRSLAMGLVELYGKSLAKTVIQTPLRKIECVYYKIVVEKYVEKRDSKGRKSGHWSTVSTEESPYHFFLADDTGAVLIDPRGAEVAIDTDHVYYFGKGHGWNSIISGYFENSSISINKTIFGNIKYKYRLSEYYIRPGEKVYILGTADKIRIKSEAVPDLPYPLLENIVVKKGKNSPIFYISDRSEKDVIKRLKWQVFGGIFGGAALFLAGLGFLGYHFLM